MTIGTAAPYRRLAAKFSVVGVFVALQIAAPIAGAVNDTPLIQQRGETGLALMEALGDKTDQESAKDFIEQGILPLRPTKAFTRVAANYGTLTPVPSISDPNCTGGRGVAVDPSGDFAYFTGGFGSPGNLCSYRIDPVTSAITPIPGARVATGANSGTVAIEPSGKFMFVAGGTSNSVWAYTIDRATGTPSPVAGSPFATNGTGPSDIVIDRGGRYVYVGNYRGSDTSPGSFTGSVAVFALNHTTGALTHIAGSPFEMNRAFNDSATSLALTPDGRFLFVGGTGVTTFAVDATSGALTHITERGALFPGGLAVDPTGRFLYVPDYGRYVVHGFAIAADGALTEIATQSYGGPPDGFSTHGIAILGDVVYVANTRANAIYGFRFNATGALKAVAGSPFAAGTKPYALGGRVALPSGFTLDAGDTFVGTYGALGGQPPYTWSVTAGTLPPGLSLNAQTGVVSGTVSGSGDYTFTAQVADSTGATAVQSKTIAVTSGTAAATNYEGLWWNSPAGSEPGWGINFAHQGDVIFATWFTYDTGGKAWWLTMTATKTAEGVYSGALYKTNGAPFNAFVPPATATQVGTGTLTFTSPSSGTFAYVVDGVAQSKAIVPQVFGPLPTCVWGAQPDLTKATNFQDLWWATGGVESGWGVNLTQEGTTIFATWFTYDANHNPLWLSATVPQTGPNAFAGTLYLTRGPAFSAVPFLPANVTATLVGTASFIFTDGNNGTFNYDVDLGDGVNKANQSKAITRQVFRAPGTVCQ